MDSIISEKIQGANKIVCPTLLFCFKNQFYRVTQQHPVFIYIKKGNQIDDVAKKIIAEKAQA